MSDSLLAGFVSAIVALVVGVVTALVTLTAGERKLTSDNVIQERKAWRVTIRRLTLEVYTSMVELSWDPSSLAKLRVELALNLNPHDLNDIEIIGLLDRLNLGSGANVDEFVGRIALLLKHDWERAKWESSFFRKKLEPEPERLPFEVFITNPRHVYRVSWSKAVSTFLFGRYRNGAERRFGRFAEQNLSTALRDQ